MGPLIRGAIPVVPIPREVEPPYLWITQVPGLDLWPSNFAHRQVWADRHMAREVQAQCYLVRAVGA